MIMIIAIAMMCVCGWVATKRTRVDVYAMNTTHGVKVYSFTMFTRALYQGNDRVVYGHLVSVIKRNVMMDEWVCGLDFEIRDRDHVVFVIRYEDVLSNNNINA